MRNVVLAVLAFGGLAVVDIAPAAAEIDYPYCMTTREGGRNCYYTSFQQCQASASGQEASCFENPFLSSARAQSLSSPGRKRYRNY